MKFIKNNESLEDKVMDEKAEKIGHTVGMICGAITYAVFVAIPVIKYNTLDFHPV